MAVHDERGRRAALEFRPAEASPKAGKEATKRNALPTKASGVADTKLELNDHQQWEGEALLAIPKPIRECF